jgi:hypothetical protein
MHGARDGSRLFALRPMQMREAHERRFRLWKTARLMSHVHGFHGLMQLLHRHVPIALESVRGHALRASGSVLEVGS